MDENEWFLPTTRTLRAELIVRRMRLEKSLDALSNQDGPYAVAHRKSILLLNALLATVDLAMIIVE